MLCCRNIKIIRFFEFFLLNMPQYRIDVIFHVSVLLISSWKVEVKERFLLHKELWFDHDWSESCKTWNYILKVTKLQSVFSISSYGQNNEHKLSLEQLCWQLMFHCLPNKNENGNTLWIIVTCAWAACCGYGWFHNLPDWLLIICDDF